MGKQGYSESGAGSLSYARIYQTRSILAELDSGKAVASAAIKEAEEAMLDGLWDKNPASHSMAESGLVHLYSHLPTNEQARVLGEMIAIGKGAQSLLDQLSSQQPFLSHDECERLKESLSKPASERLREIISLLDQPHPDEPAKPERPPIREGLDPAPLELPKEKVKVETPSKAEPGGDPDPEGDAAASVSRYPESDLLNEHMSQEARMHAAMELGPRAANPLVKLLQSENLSEREFATVTLCHLISDGASGRAVFQATQELQSDPQTRSLAEIIRWSALPSDPGHGGTSHMRNHLKNAPISDGWLSRALAHSDPISIMQASKGREIVAIPRAMETVVRQRAGEVKTVNTTAK